MTHTGLGALPPRRCERERLLDAAHHFMRGDVAVAREARGHRRRFALPESNMSSHATASPPNTRANTLARQSSRDAGDLRFAIASTGTASSEDAQQQADP